MKRSMTRSLTVKYLVVKATFVLNFSKSIHAMFKFAGSNEGVIKEPYGYMDMMLISIIKAPFDDPIVYQIVHDMLVNQ